MSSHFIPEPRRRIITAFSAGLHFVAFFAGEALEPSSTPRRRFAGGTAAGSRPGFCSKTARDVVER